MIFGSLRLKWLKNEFEKWLENTEVGAADVRERQLQTMNFRDVLVMGGVWVRKGIIVEALKKKKKVEEYVKTAIKGQKK